MGQAIAYFFRFRKPRPLTNATTSPSLVAEARVASSEQSCTRLRRLLRNGRVHPSRKPGKAVSTSPNAQPTEGSVNLLSLPSHSTPALSPAIPSSSGLHPEIGPTGAGEYDPFHHAYSLSMTDIRSCNRNSQTTDRASSYS